MQDRARPGTVPRLLAAYRTLDGVPDELVDSAGNMRPAWAGLINHLSARDPEAILRDFGRGDQYLRDAGVFFRKYGDKNIATRDWPLSPLPIILPDTEWQQIAEGLTQRADLLEMVAADLYGPNRLVAEGHLPAKVIAENPQWLRPMVGVTPQSGKFLHFIAFEIGRGPDGRWWVLGDRTEAPSGAGFALENRVASTRIFRDLYRGANVHRLAGFFKSLRKALHGLHTDPTGALGILTPGPLTDTYYEQAYIARYLGLTLMEGGDLTVEDAKLKLRTVSGLAPVDVLWRRMDAIWSDPLELEEQSQLGTPGLMSAIRQGNVTMVNALGVGVLEMQAMMAFLPRISRALTGEALKIPNIATWWCGQPNELAHVRANADRMMVGPALSTRLPFESDGAYALGGKTHGTGGLGVDDWLARDGASLVGQELVTLSTTPVYENGALVPRPMSIRVFLARTATGWTVMSGGFARIGTSHDTSAIAMRNGSSVADVWVVSDQRVNDASMLDDPQKPFVRAPSIRLPSRAADNLFWLGRYIERTEGLLRLTRAYNARLDEALSDDTALLVAMRACLRDNGVDAAQPIPDGLRTTMAAAVNSASQIRDRFSVDGWAALQDLDKTMDGMALTATTGNDAALAMGVLLRKITGFSGLVHENMYHATGWRFLGIGRALERAANLADILVRFGDPLAPDGGLDLAVELGDISMTHRQRYGVTTQRDSVVDLLGLDGRNPRSVLYSLTEIRAQAERLDHMKDHRHLSTFERKVLAVHSFVTLQSPQTMDSAALRSLRSDILGLSDALTLAYLP